VKTDVAAPPPGPVGPEEEAPAQSRKPIIILLLFMGVMGALWTIGPIVFAGRDDPTAIDNKTVRKAVVASCTQLRADLAAVPGEPAPAGRAEAENRAVEAFLSRIRSLGPDMLAKDVPVDHWLADWEHLVAIRREAVRDQKPFAIPLVDGTPINVRMFSLVRSGLTQCDVPAQLLAPEPGRL
jgi:hypothetical protein